MDHVALRIELPAYSYSFTISVPQSSTILQVKEVITTTCPGQPSAQGQRLISKGRNLSDEEKVDDLWKAPSDSRILHLAVHPSAWKGSPPSLPPRQALSDPPRSLPPTQSVPSPWAHYRPPSLSNPHFYAGILPPTSQQSTAPSNFARMPHKPIPYIVLMHQNALSALITGNPPAFPYGRKDLRQGAVHAVQKLGWTWPSLLDEAYPTVVSQDGFKYVETTVNGQPYLSLENPSGTPTPVQTHALKVLSSTFTLLEISVISTSLRSSTTYTFDTPNQENINRLLQHFNMPPLRVAPNANNGLAAQLQLREIPLRPLLMPLGMLVFRMALLLYFVGPVRKPIFGVFFLAWILYELWQPVRDNLLQLGRVRQPPANANANVVPHNPQNEGPNQNAPQNQGALGQPAAPANARPFEANAARQWDLRIEGMFDTLADVNLQDEQRLLDQADQGAIPEPSLGHKFASFFSLFFATLHPAVWDRRRTQLRRREGPIRTEANIRRQPDPEPVSEPAAEAPEGGARPGQPIDNNATQVRDELRAKHARRPRWVQEYIERVVAEEWVDDLD